MVTKSRARPKYGEQPVPEVDVGLQCVVQGEGVVPIVEGDGRLGGFDEVDDGFEREVGIRARSNFGQQTKPEFGSRGEELGPRRVGEAQSSKPGLATGVPILVAVGHALTLALDSRTELRPHEAALEHEEHNRDRNRGQHGRAKAERELVAGAKAPLKERQPLRQRVQPR